MKPIPLLLLLFLLSITASYAQVTVGAEGGSVSLGSAYADGAMFVGGTITLQTAVFDPRLALGCAFFSTVEWADESTVKDALALRPYAALTLEKPFQLFHSSFFIIPGLGIAYTYNPLQDIALNTGIMLTSVSARVEYRLETFNIGLFVEPGLARYSAEGLTTVLDGLGLSSLRLGATVGF